MNLEKKRVEEILCALDEKGYIFPGFELVKNNNQLCLLGKGGFSTVYEVRCLDRSDNQYVLKVIGLEKHVMTSENFQATVRLQRYLCEQTQYVCRVISAREIRIVLDEEGNLQQITETSSERWDEDGIHLQLVLMEKLEDIVSKDRFGKISLKKSGLEREEEVVEFALQVGGALLCAHNSNVLHRDVKLENIFWDNTLQCYKLGDFGIAKFTEGGMAETIVYTDGYGAPEIERRLYDYYGVTADIYSFGITLYLLLNDLKFPGSQGYYVNMVQYDPDFVFPAPAHASERMTRIIRKMCQFYQEDRYQSVAEVLMDLSALKDGNAGPAEREEIELPDFETETYREEKHANGTDKIIREVELTGREKRKEEEKMDNKRYMKSSILNFIGFALLFTFFLYGLSTNTNDTHNWKFWIFPVMVLIEAILLGAKEFHILFGVITLAVGIYSCVSIGVTAPHVLLAIGLLIGVPVVTGACAVSTIIWATLAFFGKMSKLSLVGGYDISWILLIIILFMLLRYAILRIELNKTTYIRVRIGFFVLDKIYLVMVVIGVLLLLLEHFGVIHIPEMIQQLHLVRTGMISFVIYVIYMKKCGCIDDDLGEEEVQLYENKMDERGDGECSDTIE